MKLILTLLLNSIILFASAQYSPALKGKASCSRFLNSTTCLVLSDDDAFNERLIDAMDESWTITPFKIIDAETFESYVIETKYSFVFAQDFNVKGNKKEIGALALFNGGFTDTEFYLTSSLAYVTYDNWGLEKTTLDIYDRLPGMVYQLHETISLISKLNITGNNEEAITRQLDKVYNARAGVLKNKTLLIDKRYLHMKIVSEEDFENIYKYKFEFVGAEDIKKAIDSRASNKAVLYSSYNIDKVNIVMDCRTLEIVWSEKEVYDPVVDPNLELFDNGDLEALNASVKKSKVD